VTTMTHITDLRIPGSVRKAVDAIGASMSDANTKSPDRDRSPWRLAAPGAPWKGRDDQAGGTLMRPWSRPTGHWPAPPTSGGTALAGTSAVPRVVNLTRTTSGSRTWFLCWAS